ncbi:MAG: hypothetical protein OK474_00540 [Thaumarchaeota archaeon]|nr:hypothetical protein [Nitrososphaerota archaeon]
MTVYESGSTHNSTTGASYVYNGTSTYKELYSPKSGSDTYKVNFTESLIAPPESGIVWITTSGFVIAVEISGQNLTGAAAYSAAATLTDPFPLEAEYGTPTFLQSSVSFPGVVKINQTTVTLGPTTMLVTNYGINSPMTVCTFGGTPDVFSVYSIQAGSVPGTTATIVPLRSTTGVYTAPSGGTLTFTAILRITSVTKL